MFFPACGLHSALKKICPAPQYKAFLAYLQIPFYAVLDKDFFAQSFLNRLLMELLRMSSFAAQVAFLQFLLHLLSCLCPLEKQCFHILGIPRGIVGTWKVPFFLPFFWKTSPYIYKLMTHY